MVALITGASSGIGREMAKILSEKGYDLILVARRKKRLQDLKKELKTNVEIINMDISSTFNCMSLYEQVKDKNIDILINNAGFGIFGEFLDSNLDKELDLIDTNIKATHILTKLFLKDFKNKDEGYILNVVSSAGFMPGGPLMSSYYASKSYVLSLTSSIYEELKKTKSNVYIGALCPGPVDTEFNKVAKVKFGIKSLSASYVANYAIKNMFKRKLYIIPGFNMRISTIFSKILSRKVLLKIAYNIQRKKEL
ncbi:MAG: SDR family oxidoreductase [Bacilli bacterium]|nr:SDR family oxidoreductase [Bacilli bacterium]